MKHLATEGSLVFPQVGLNNSLMASCKFCKKKLLYIILNWSLFNKLYTARKTTLYTLMYVKLLCNNMYFSITLNKEKKSGSTPEYQINKAFNSLLLDHFRHAQRSSTLGNSSTFHYKWFLAICALPLVRSSVHVHIRYEI